MEKQKLIDAMGKEMEKAWKERDAISKLDKTTIAGKKDVAYLNGVIEGIRRSMNLLGD